MALKARKAGEKAVRSKAAAADGDETRNLRSTVQSLAKGFRVLEALASDSEEMTLSEIAVASDLDPGTTFRMLNTLVDLGYVARIPESRRFTLTLKVLDLGFHAIARRDVRSVVRPVLRTLVGDVSEAASFAVLDGADVLYIERVRAGMTRLGVDIRIGTTVPASRTAIGQAILAMLPPDELARVLDLTPRSMLSAQDAANLKALPTTLAGIRADGYILIDSLITEGLRLIAVPVLDPDRYPIGAVSIAAPSVRTTQAELKQKALGPLRAAAEDISRALEASGGVASVFSGTAKPRKKIA